MLRRLLAISFLFLLFSCQSSEQNSLMGGEGLGVDKSALISGVLRLSLPEDHPRNMSIKTPNNDWYIIQDSDASILFFSQEEFDKTKNIEFDINSLKGVVWREGRRIVEQVFTVSGEYLIYFANNLETEPENTFSMSIAVDYQKR